MLRALGLQSWSTLTIHVGAIHHWVFTQTGWKRGIDHNSLAKMQLIKGVESKNQNKNVKFNCFNSPGTFLMGVVLA